MMQSSCINLQHLTLSDFQELSANGDRFRNEFAQHVASQGTSIKSDQQELFIPVGRNPVYPNKDRRNASTQATRRTIAVDFSLTRIHHAQVALAVYDFAGEHQSSQV